MHTKIREQEFVMIETERSKVLNICDDPMITSWPLDRHNFILWKNEGEYAIITKGQIKEALRVFKELNSAPEDQMSTAGFPCIMWDDCLPVNQLIYEALLGKEHEFYCKPDEGEDSTDG